MSGHLDQPSDPIHERCGIRDNEKIVADVLRSEAGSIADAVASGNFDGIKNPFTVCAPVQPEFGLQQVLVAATKLCGLGKLAKNGHFFASEDGTLLVKRVENREADVLRNWGELALSTGPRTGKYPGGCLALSNTLLAPILTDFAHGGRQYIVMPNLTHDYTRASPTSWLVQAVYDAKPLPNLGEGLVKLVKGLRNEWGSGLPKLNAWEAWDEVRLQLSMDLDFLKDRVVDFSLFVHVIQHQGDADALVPTELGPKKGCVVAPSRKTILCFRILDYLTPYDWKREFESQYKASKFDDYAKKFLLAFDCIGDISREDCTNYKAAASITDAMEVSKAMAKAVFIGVQAFPTSYTCTHETPGLRFRQILYTRRPNGAVFEHPGKVLNMFGNEEEIELIREQERIVKEVEFYSRPEESGQSIAKSLQSVASKEAGTGYIKDFCDCSEQSCTDLECTQILLQYAVSQNRERPLGKDHLDLDGCAQMINEFSTEGYTSSGNARKPMHNVIWAPTQNVVIAVRGLPKIPLINISTYVHRDALERGRLNNCFLKMHYFRCTPEDSAGVYFNYKQHFGTLEVMLLQAGEFSGDQDAFAKAMEMGVKTSPE